MKTVRFSQVVARSGKPQAHAFWVAPEKDTPFLAAQKADRVMTVAPSAPGKADVGTVGFDPARAHAGQVLIFPRSLRAFDGAHVIGIKFDQLEQPEMVAGEREIPAPKHHRKKTAPPAANGAPKEMPARNSRLPKTEEAVADRNEDREDREVTPERRRPPRSRGGERGKAAGGSPRAARHDAAESALRREVKAAISELKAGKAVAAYERLQRAIAE